MKIMVIGTHLPGGSFCDPDGGLLDDVRVGLQVHNEHGGLVRGDAAEGRWYLDVTTILDGDRELDFRRPAVHGKRGDPLPLPHLGNVDGAGTFHIFRRAKIMLNRIDRQLIDAASAAERPLVATVRLTDDRGGPRCARVDPPAISWSLG